MTYNIDFLIAAMVILLLVLWYFLGQKRAEDLNNQVFLFFAIIGILNVVAELASNYYISFPNSNCEIAAMLATTIFYLLQALLPFTVICYIQTLHDNKIISAKKMFLSGVPTFILMGMILTNPFTEKLFYFDIPAGYMKGPWYMLMYYSALCHMAAALILIVIWRKKLGYQKVKSLLEILLISGAGVVIQLLYHPLLTTGFGMSLGILVLFITINNPHANIDTLTGLYNLLYLARKSNELISAGKSFHIITVYLYQLKHINKIAGVQGGNSILKLTARKLPNASNKIGIILLGLILIGICTQEIFFCQFLCPMGAVFAMMPILPSALFNRNRDKCPSKCGLCRKSCPALLEIDGDTPLSGECICCHACQVTCPRKNIQIGPVKEREMVKE